MSISAAQITNPDRLPEENQFHEVRAMLEQCLLQDRYRLDRHLRDMARAGEGPRRAKAIAHVRQQAQVSIARRQRRAERFPQVTYPPDLPITARRSDIVEAIKNHPVVIIAGETGSGKTTQLPKMCLEAGLGLEGKIGCTQPRRVAALSISRRIAEELGVEWGKEVGCKMRFNDHCSPDAFIKVMTDGILLAETHSSPELAEYEVIIVDEAHERSLNIDFLLGYLRLLLERRKDLKVIITSATIDTGKFAAAFGGAPVLQVSGRLFPVEVVYAPLPSDDSETEETSYLDSAVAETDRILSGTSDGDILVFLPGERDIREARERIAGLAAGVEVIPLFSRLSAADQAKVFATGPRRKVVLSTNIAETSLTIPRIRYVIDSGLARLSRYHPRTRTRRLPIEPISQSSANQRMGRCGRVREGVCVRLYSQEDFEARPPFTQPEIQRSNLAEVILRLKALRLADIEQFPFLDRPSTAAIETGKQLLTELGALDESEKLTRIGWELARLPVDPTIGRMLLEAKREKVLPQLLIIAAGLSVQDPRDRPEDQKEAAENAHKRFQDPGSDFLTFLNLWNAVEAECESPRKQNQLRKFCKKYFLHYWRMREWQDLHGQLQDAFEEVEESPLPPKSPAEIAAIHRSILTGLWSQVGLRTDRNLYRSAGNQELMIFPGSSLFETASKKGPKEQGPPAAQARRQARWVVAGEIVETSRRYARSVAEIDARWILELAPHLCRTAYFNPQWSRPGGRVWIDERTTFFGLEVRLQKVDFAKVDPAKAAEIFIRSALIEEDLDRSFPFLEHNRRLRHKFETWQTRLRHSAAGSVDELLYHFYAARIGGISSLRELRQLLDQNSKTNPRFLFLEEEDLSSGNDLGFRASIFPDTVEIGGWRAAVEYRYSPGEDADGATIRLRPELLPQLDPARTHGFIPGFREEQISHLLRALPKTLRRPFVPVQQSGKEIAAHLEATGLPMLEGMTDWARQRLSLDIPVSAWPVDQLPAYLRPRFELVGANDRILGVSRQLDELQAQLQKRESEAIDDRWRKLCQRWEKYHLTRWSFPDLPEAVEFAGEGDLALKAFPGLMLENGEVSLRLFRTAGEAAAATPAGARHLGELAMAKELAWAQKDLRPFERFNTLYVTLGPGEELVQSAFAHLRSYLFELPEAFELKADCFQRLLEQARQRLPGLVPRLLDQTKAILEIRHQLLLRTSSYPHMRAELDRLVPPGFLSQVPFAQLPHLVRYLKGIQVRAERAALNPPKDLEKSRQIAPFAEKLSGWQKHKLGPQSQREAERFKWMLEELKISVFAQELGTAMTVSAKRLAAQAELVETAIRMGY